MDVKIHLLAVLLPLQEWHGFPSPFQELLMVDSEAADFGDLKNQNCRYTLLDWVLQYCLAAWLVYCMVLRQYCTKRAAGALHAARGLLLGTPQPPNLISVALGYRESFCIHYKVLMLLYKAIKEQSPSYLSELVTLYSAGHRLRSTDTGLCASSMLNCATLGGRSFSHCARGPSSSWQHRHCYLPCGQSPQAGHSWAQQPLAGC